MKRTLVLASALLLAARMYLAGDDCTGEHQAYQEHAYLAKYDQALDAERDQSRAGGRRARASYAAYL